jgi:iron complex transport system substrate-binding protein
MRRAAGCPVGGYVRCVRIVSLLPSATEILFALGLGPQIVAVTDECTYPPEAASLPVVSRCVLAGESLTPSEIDARVSDVERSGESLYSIDAAMLEELRPDVIVTQDLCPVCALPATQAEAALHDAHCTAHVISLDPHSIDDVLQSMSDVGDALGANDAAERVITNLRSRVDNVRQRAAGLERRSVLALEWGEPPWGAGHWVPEMIELAGGTPLLGEHRQDSRRLTWDEIADAAPEIIAYMPCSYGLDDAAMQGRDLFEHPEFANTPAAKNGRVYATAAEAYFSRSGPRLVDGLEVLAAITHPEVFGEPPAHAALRIDRGTR